MGAAAEPCGGAAPGMADMSRLPWQRNPDGGFIAYPEGDDRPERRVTLYWAPKAAHEPQGAPEWRWFADWPGKFSVGGRAYAKQQAADEATEAWGRAIATADQRDTAERPIRAFVDRLVSTGLFDLADIDFQNLPQPQLSKLMDELTAIWKGHDGGSVYRKQIHEVMKVLSMELFRRRLAAETPRKS